MAKDKRFTPEERRDPDVVTVRFVPHGMVSSYVVQNAEGDTVKLKGHMTVNLKTEYAHRLAATFPESFIIMAEPSHNRMEKPPHEVK
jgi:uncharacterized protein Veg